MSPPRSRGTVALVSLGIAGLFLIPRWPLLHGSGIVDLLTYDSSIIALMGKKMAGGGFDVFCWGVTHLGPLTSLVTLVWAWPLGALGAERVWPLAVRLATMTEIALGIALIGWAVARIDRRAAAITAMILAFGPPILFKVSVIALGHEMAFLLGAAVLAIGMQHVTAPAGHGWLSVPAGRFLFGALTGLGWWMNRTVVLAAGGVILVLLIRSELFARIRGAIRLSDRLLLRAPAGSAPIPGVLEAAAFLAHWSGMALIAFDVVCGFFRRPPVLVLPRPILDGIVLVVLGQCLHLLPRLRAHHLLAPRLSPEVRATIQGAVGFAIGAAPAFLAAALDWYPHAYQTPFEPFTTGIDMLAGWKSHAEGFLSQTFGLSATPVGIVYGIALAILAVSALVRHRRDAGWGPRALLAAVVLLSLAFALFVKRGMSPRYLMTAFGPFFALLALEALHWWDTRRRTTRALVAIAFGACMISVVTGAVLEREKLYPSSNAVMVLDRMRALDCRVCYLSGYHGYTYRLLSDEQIAAVPSSGHDLTPEYTAAVRQLPGRRCVVTDAGAVLPMSGEP